MDRKTFPEPEAIYRGTDFWMLNDRLSEEEIHRQLTEMKQQGVYSFIARTYIGLKSDYPGPDFHQKMGTIIDAARKNGMKVFLQAGYMPEAVVGLPEEYALRYIFPVSEGQEDGRPVFCTHNGISYVEHNSRTFLNMFHPESVRYYLKKSYEEMWEEFAGEYGKTVLSVWVDEPSYNVSYLPWTPGLEEEIRSRYGEDIREKLYLLYEEGEGCKTVRYFYWTTLRDLLEKNYFAQIRDWCHAHDLMFSGHLMMEDCLTAQISRACAIMPYYKYFDIPGIDRLCGSMDWQDSPIQGEHRPEHRDNLYTTALQCTSAAHQAGKHHVLCEMYGVTTESMSFRDYLYMFDEYAALGINHRCVHGMFYSLGGRGKRAYPPHVSYYQPYWKKYKNVTDYVARVSKFIDTGKPVSDLLVVHPLETAYTLYTGPLHPDREKGCQSEAGHLYDRKLYDVLHTLVSLHLSPELGDLSTLSSEMTVVENGQLRVGEMSYRRVLLPHLDCITTSFLEKLEQFVQGGGQLVILGSYPSLLDGKPDVSAAKRLKALTDSFCRNEGQAAALFLLTGTAYGLEGTETSSLFVNHSRNDSEDYFMIHNNSCVRASRFTLRMEGSRNAESMDAFTGSLSPVAAFYDTKTDSTALKLEIPAGQSLCLILHRGTISVTAEKPARLPRTLSLSDGTLWEVSPCEENALYLENCRYKTGEGEFSRILPIMAVQKLLTDRDYRGPLTLEYEIYAQTETGSLQLAMEHPGAAKIFLNGEMQSNLSDGYFWAKEFEKVPLSSPLLPGRNLLRLEMDFEPLSKSTSAINSLFETQLGCELEPLYLLGNFRVACMTKASRNGCLVAPDCFMIVPAEEKAFSGGELRSCGYPFYTGSITLSREFEISEEEVYERAEICLGTVNGACAEVRLNGVSLGDLNRAPGSVCCGTALKPGRNRLEITVTGTLHSVIGPFHRPLGNVGNVFGGEYSNPNYAWLCVDTTRSDWAERISDFWPEWTDDYNLTPFGLDNISLKLF